MLKTIVVSGASSGVGRDICQLFTENDWRVVGLARQQRQLDSVRERLGERFVGYSVDVRDAAALVRVFDAISSYAPVIDLLVNNAAVFKMASFTDCSSEDVNEIIDTNLKGTMFCCLNAIKLLKSPGGRIINISSVAGTHGISEQAIYCASKFGINGFFEALGQELTGRGILLTSICPGGIDTPLWNVERNPYPGDSTHLLRPRDISRLVEYISNLPRNVVLKEAIVFPNNEWH